MWHIVMRRNQNLYFVYEDSTGGTVLSHRRTSSYEEIFQLADRTR